MMTEILSSSLAAVTALGTVERVVAATAFALQLGALVGIRRFLGGRPPAPVRDAGDDYREAA